MERRKKENLTQEEKQTPKKPWEEKSALEATAADHEVLGSTPPTQLKENPGKNLAELMSDKEILEWLKKSEHAIKVLKKEAPSRGLQWEDVRDREIVKMKVTLKYLEGIGRLPEEFKYFDVDGIESEE